MPQPSLKQQWLTLCDQLGIDGLNQWTKIQHAHTSFNLAYHNLDHIADCLKKFSTRREEATAPLAIEFAIWFHDIIYDPRASDNEEQSAKAAASFIPDASLAKSVSDLILATQHRDSPTSLDAQLLCDIDLSILGSSPEAYQQYATAIRQEYSWVSQENYRKGRVKLLQNFLKRPSIFSLKKSCTLYETQARQNIQAEINSLSA